MTVMFVLTTMLGALPFQAAAAANVTDINGHWAQGQIQTMVDKGAIGGYPDNTFKPERITTRAEFISMTNRAFSFNETVEINYTDVESNDWFAPDIAKAKAAGYIAGYSDGSMKPNNSITRQEVAVIVANILELDTAGGTEALSKFTDAASIPAWSGNAIAAMVEAGYLSGYPDGTFKAANSTTRAVAAVILCAATGGVVPPTLFDKAGTYGPADGTQTIEGNVTISAPDVILQNTEITGNLLIAASVGEGNVNLKNVNVTGTTTINGGGAHSIYIDNSTLGNVISNKPSVHISCVNGATIVSLTLANGATVDVAAGSTIEGVTVSTTGEITLNGDFANVNLAGADTNVSLASGTIESLNVAATATGAAVNIAAGAQVTTFTADATVAITGNGTITTADINVSGVTTTIQPANTNTAPGVTPPTAPPADGGGGGSSPVTVTELNVELTDLASQSVVSDGFTFDLSECAPTAVATQMKITTTPSAAITNATLTISSIKTRGIEFLSTPITETISDGVVAISQLLAGKSNVSLGALRTIFGSQDIIIKGKISKTGYTFNSGKDMTITIKLGAGGTAIDNKYVKIEKKGEGEATVTVKDPNAKVGELRGKGFNFAAVIASVFAGINDDVDDDTANFINAVLLKINIDAFDDLTLGQLIGKTVTFGGYTVSFE